MSREGFVPPSAANLGNAASGIQSIKNFGVKYVCAQCAVNFTLSPKEPVRCKECGHRVLYKARTKRMVPTKIRIHDEFSLNDYRISMLNKIKPNLIHDDNNIHNNTQIKHLILNLINKYQIYRNLDIEKFKITPILKSNIEKYQLPKLPSTLDNLSNFIYDLTLIPNFELTFNNQIIKSNVLKSLSSSSSSSSKSNDNSYINKLLVINEIINPNLNSSYNTINNFKKLNFNNNNNNDNDLQYLAWFVYFMNPDKLNMIERFNQFHFLLNYFNFKNQENILINDWEFTNNLINSNLLSFNTNFEIEKSFILDNLIKIINNINNSYKNFELINIFRTLRNAETGYEDLNSFKLIRFNIGYYRYLLLDKLINEWNKDSITEDLWNLKKLQYQWEIIYEIYYSSKNSIKPGGITFENKIKNMIS
ncbi:DNA-directed RNA polymerase core subunit rpc10 [Pichia californica]|nr:DNA-directed RNA polymerase core subunit rpc10 [[Candida] californica]